MKSTIPRYHPATGGPSGSSNVRRRPILLNLAVLLTVSLLCLFVLEVVARLYYARDRENMESFRRYRRDPARSELNLVDMIRPVANTRLVYDLIPGTRGTYEGAEVAISDQGLRDRSFRTEKPDGVFRIVSLGDSIAFGQGVEADETYAKRLQDTLNRLGAEVRYEVMNFGIPGYNTVMEVEQLRERAAEFDPDLVLIEYCINDQEIPNFVSRPADAWSPRRFFLARWVREALQRSHGERSEPRQTRWLEDSHREGAEIPPEYQGLVGRQAFVQAMHELARFAAEKDIPVVQTYALYDFEDFSAQDTVRSDPDYAWVVELSEELGIAIADPAPPTRAFLDRVGTNSTALWVDPMRGDAHPNPALHLLMTQAILTTLVHENLIPDAERLRPRLPDIAESMQRRAMAALVDWTARRGASEKPLF